MNITFMQTCDSSRYAPLLDISSATVKAYVCKFGYDYSSFIGVRRGYFPWQASYNRIPMLMEMVQAGYSGWVCYMDADSYISDLNFDLKDYVKDKDDIAFIAAHSGIEPPLWFDVNNGVFLINLSHIKAKALVRSWYDRFMAISDVELREAEVWGSIPHDQLLLHQAMQEVEDIKDHIIVDMSHPKLLNYASGKFIRQVLREGGGTIEERARTMTSDIKNVMTFTDIAAVAGSIPVHPDIALLEEYFIQAIYRVFLLRQPDTEEFTEAVTRFRANKNTIEQELKNCLSSPEFSAKSEEFLRRFSPGAALLRTNSIVGLS